MLQTFYTHYEIVIKIICMLVLVLILCQIYNFIRAISIHIDTKTASIKLSDKNIMINRLESRVSSTNAVLTLIDTIISNEVNSTLKTYIRLGEKYNNIKLDDDIKDISIRVYNAIKKEIFDSNDTVVTDEYLMQYITEQTTLSFLISTHNINNQLTT